MRHNWLQQHLSIKFPDGYEKQVLSEVDSTNALALREAKVTTFPTWFLGLKQTKGRGRRGRPWMDPVGNFAGTLLLFPKDSPDKIALRSFAAACALYNSFADVIGNDRDLSLKWPNDVLLNGQKVAGILLETTVIGKGTFALAIGIGVNLRHAPQAASLETRAVSPTSLYEATGIEIDPETFLTHLAHHYAEAEFQLANQGFAPIRALWLSHAARLGEVITARVAQKEITGTFDTVDETGHLILLTDTGRQAIAAADIYF